MFKDDLNHYRNLIKRFRLGVFKLYLTLMLCFGHFDPEKILCFLDFFINVMTLNLLTFPQKL